ncbi:MAG: hypothetical protein AAF662_10600 [Pseudomonadota bacterium]
MPWFVRLFAMAVFLFFPLVSAGQTTRSVDRVRLPQCEKLSDLEDALDRLEKVRNFARNDDYKFLKGFGKRCGRYKIRSRSTYNLHTFYRSDGVIFAIYEVTGGRGYEGGRRVGFVANSFYRTDDWRVGKGNECAMRSSTGNCLVPRRCRVIRDEGGGEYYQKIALDEFFVPPHCYGVGREER